MGEDGDVTLFFTEQVNSIADQIIALKEHLKGK